MNLRVHLLTAGTCRQLDAAVRLGGGLRQIDFPAGVAVIEHPDAGVWLFDTGYTQRFFTETRRWPAALYAALTPVSCSSADPVVVQLPQLGIATDRVAGIVVSHLHADHIGGLRDFPDAQLVWSASAQAHSQGGFTDLRHGFLPGLLPDDWQLRQQAAETFAPVATGLAEPFDTGWDLFGDASALLIALPGHHKGHLGCWLPATQGPPVLLVADACWSGRALSAGQLPPRLVRRLVMASTGQYAATITALAELHRRQPEILIVPSHCAPSITLARRVLGQR